MRLIDLTHARVKKSQEASAVPVVVRSVDPIHLVPLDKLVTLATVVDIRSRFFYEEVGRPDIARTAVADIGGCILFSGWCRSKLAGTAASPPTLTIDAAAYLLENGVGTVAADFPLIEDAADLLLHNGCVIVHCVSNVEQITKPIVRLVALPIKYEDVFSADARVIVIEEP